MTFPQYDEIKKGIDVRENLSALNDKLKDVKIRYEFIDGLEDNYDILISLLSHEDPKVRKNVARTIGIIGDKVLLPMLFKAYQRETVLFVRPAYLKALKEFDYGEYIYDLQDRLNYLASMEVKEEERKHISEEMHMLTKLLVELRGIDRHIYMEPDKALTMDVILLTNRNYREVTLDAVKNMDVSDAKIFNAGVMVETSNLKQLYDVRTFDEALIRIPKLDSVGNDAKQAGIAVAKSDLLKLLESRHLGDGSFYFRIDIRSKEDMGKKSQYAKRMAAAIESETKRKLINSPSNYEIEIRLIMSKTGDYKVLLKLYTLKDVRFSYRIKQNAFSMKPSNCALIVALAKNYLKENGRVLDPYCGVGTLLIERYKSVKADTTYGVDILEDAIDMAKENTKAVNQIIHYVNKSFNDFTHEYKFDEIITDMPFVTGGHDIKDVEQIYKDFFNHVGLVLADSGVIIMHTRNYEFAKKYGQEFKLLERFELSKREESYLLIMAAR